MREIRSVLLVTNPLSGHGRGLTAAGAARARLAERDVRIAEVRGRTAADTVRLVRDAVTGRLPGPRPDAVVCVGGDGLICVTLQALAGSGVALGLIPGGTGNDLARELGIPEDDPVGAAEVIAAGRVRTIDLGVIEAGAPGADPREAIDPTFGAATSAGTVLPEPLRFATVAATGFDARVTLRANAMRRPRGSLRYTLAAVAELAGRLAVPYRIALSGRPDGAPDTVLETAAVMVAVGNTHSYGGGMLICPDAVIDDGLLELTVVGAMPRWQMVRLLPTLSAGRRVDHPAISRYRAATISLSAPNAPVTADGEPAGALPATFRALPGAAAILVP